MGESGHIVWPSPSERIWEFTWSLSNAPDQEGIVISHARYRGRGAIYKASVPLLRVQYDGACGPYRIPLNYDNVQFSSGARVDISTYVDEGFRALSIAAMYGAYAITVGTDKYVALRKVWQVVQRWVFWDDGEVFARINGTFNHCQGAPHFHAYFRFDLDIDTAGNNLALEYNNTTGDLGWGRGCHTKTTETSRVRDLSSARKWLVLNKTSKRGYRIVPPSSGGPADAFANRDVWIVRYHGFEDTHGNVGSAYADDLQTYVDGENIDGRDVVIWYCHHHRPNWADQRGGPNLQAVGNWT